MFVSDDGAEDASEAAPRESPEAATRGNVTEERKDNVGSQEGETKDAAAAKGYCSQEGGSTQTETAFPRTTADNEGVLLFKSEGKSQRPAAVRLTPRKRQFEPGMHLNTFELLQRM